MPADRLFREEAVKSAESGANSTLLLPQLPKSTAIAVVAALMLCGVFLFLCLVPYSDRVTVSGQVTASEGVTPLRATTSGILHLVHTRAGRHLDANAAVATIRTSPYTSEGDVAVALTQSVAREREALLIQMRVERTKLSQERSSLVRAIEAARSEKSEAGGRLDNQAEQLELAQAELRRAEGLSERGYMPQRALDERRMLVLSHDTRLSELREAVHRLEHEIEESQSRLGMLPAEQDALDADQDRQLQQIHQRQAELSIREGYQLRSSTAARVLAITAHSGQRVEAGDVLAVLAPDSDELIVELYVPSSAAARLRPGQSVELRYDAYPYQSNGVQTGRISDISDVAIAPEVSGGAALGVSEPTFLANVTLDADDAGTKFHLLPGFRASAIIVTDRRSLMSRLLAPLRGKM